VRLDPMTARLIVFAAAFASSPAFAQEVWKWQGTARVEVTGPATIKENGGKLGRLSMRRYEQSLRRRVKASESVYAMIGASYERLELELPAAAPLPERLHGVAARLGVEWLIDSKSWAFVDAAPGLYGDEGLSGRAFNAPVAAQYNRLLRPGLRVLGGLLFDPMRESKVLPFGGAAWRLSPRWNLRLTLPEPRAEYRLLWDDRQTVDAFAGLSLTGGQYRVARDLGARRGRREVNGQTLGYASTRVLAGARWMRGDLELEAYGGWAQSRTFRYEPSGVELKAKRAPIGGLTLSGRL
jgi:hypothetical protein